MEIYDFYLYDKNYKQVVTVEKGRIKKSLRAYGFFYKGMYYELPRPVNVYSEDIITLNKPREVFVL